MLERVRFLCRECALANGGRWPRGLQGTWHEGQCDVCGKVKGLANVGDWNWPDGVARGERGEG